MPQSTLDAASAATTHPFPPADTFRRRHVGPSDADIASMLQALGFSSMGDFLKATIPDGIRLRRALEITDPTNGGGFAERGEFEAIEALKRVAGKNQVFRSFLGMGYHDTITPPVILRNILENPGWYTQYTPYQAEIAQGRLEALLNFQTMIADLTGLPLAGASLLDEGTAAAEAMTMAHGIVDPDGANSRNEFFVAEDCHPQTIAVIEGRAKHLGIKVVIGNVATASFGASTCGVVVQYPTTDGRIEDYRGIAAKAHEAGAMVIAAADLLSLALITPPGEWGADICIGNSQRFGVPFGFGGPHAAFIATKSEFVRKMPGRIIGVSRDSHGNPALRMAIQTREQHIRRERATSNICTAQVLLAIIAGMYGAYHGPEGVKAIASRVHRMTAALSEGLRKLGHDVGTKAFFDTLRVKLGGGVKASDVHAAAQAKRMNLRSYADGSVGVALDECTTEQELATLLACFAGGKSAPAVSALGNAASPVGTFRRTSEFMTHPVFSRYHSETEMLRYIFKLMSRDLSLAQSMISLGSCTMKLNATSEMIPVTWPEFGRIHPFVPKEQAQGYVEMCRMLENWLSEITGFAAVSLQPNAGSQGEYAGLLVIRAYHEHRGDVQRDVCLIPETAHGTNPASAVVAGLKVVAVACDEMGYIDLNDLKAKAAEHEKHLAALMVTYPSTAGIFEESIKELCEVVHKHGGQVYMDGANMNAQVGLTRPGDIGADVCHLNLHKTFCIPHGGGGPGVGPIGVAAHLKDFRASGVASRIGRSPCDPAGVGRRLRQREHPADFVGLHRPDGRRGPAAGDRGGDPERQLHGPSAQGPLQGRLRQPKRPSGPRVHHRLPSVRPLRRHQDRRRGETAHRLRVPRSDHELAGARHAHDRTDRERVEGRDRPLLRRPHRHSRRDQGDRGRQGPEGRQRPEARPAHRGRGLKRRLEARLLPREGGVSGEVAPRLQVLATRRPGGQPVRRPEPRLRVSADGGVCVTSGDGWFTAEAGGRGAQKELRGMIDARATRPESISFRPPRPQRLCGERLPCVTRIGHGAPHTLTPVESSHASPHGSLPPIQIKPWQRRCPALPEQLEVGVSARCELDVPNAGWPDESDDDRRRRA